MTTAANPHPVGTHDFFKTQLENDCNITAESWAELKKIGDQHHEDIWGIWMTEQTTEEARHKILDLANEGQFMSPTRRPDIDPPDVPNEYRPKAYRDAPNHSPISSWLLPHLSKEDLAYKGIIPRFIHYRSKYHWLDFARNDLHSTRGGQMSRRLGVRTNIHGYWAQDKELRPKRGQYISTGSSTTQ